MEPLKIDILDTLRRKLETRTAWIYQESHDEIVRLRARVAELEAQLKKKLRK